MAEHRPARATVLGLPVDLVDMGEALERLVACVEGRRLGQRRPGLRVATLNPEMVMRARRDPELAAALGRVDLAIPDGIGLVRALRRRGHRVARVTGIDLVEGYAGQAAALGHRLALVGSASGVAELAGRRLSARHPGLVIAAASADDPTPGLARRLASARPDVILAAYSMEGQARFLDRHLDDCDAAVGIGVGGSLDILAGRLPRAPLGLRAIHLEWAWRLVRQPWRWRRQLDLPRFWWAERREVRRSRLRAR